MMVKINVLKAFRFTLPADRAKGQALPVEKVFAVGEQEIDKDIAAHPWMAAPGYADGCIESEEQAQARKTIADKKAKEAAQVIERANASAQAAQTRMERVQPQREAASIETHDDLNTPVGVLRARQGAVKEPEVKPVAVEVSTKKHAAVKPEVHRRPPASKAKHGRSAHT
jgi:hypothetical protein